MNLLVTNTRNAQAYAIIRALRPYSQKIVVTMEGENRLAARLSHAANSRLVDKTYYTPSPAADWRAGRIQRENTEREEAYIRAVERICEREKIDIIFPSFDPHMYVFSKNKERFENMGVLIPVPDYERVEIPLDKGRTIRAAEEMDFPCPRTYLPASRDDLRRISEELGFPLVIKPRFGSAGGGVELIADLPELLEKTRHFSNSQDMPLMQEYIPGGERLDFNLVLDRKGELKFSFCSRELRHLVRRMLNFPTAAESVDPYPFAMRVTKFMQQLGWWGAVTVQMKFDPRDRIPKLIEINPRLGYRLWLRTEQGINEPLMCLKILRGEEVEPITNRLVGTLLLDPMEDLMALGVGVIDLVSHKFRAGVRRIAPLDTLNLPMTLKELVVSYTRTYFTRRKVLNPYVRYFFQDPLVSFFWWGQYLNLTLRNARQLGR